jgi:hypothetical protein
MRTESRLAARGRSTLVAIIAAGSVAACSDKSMAPGLVGPSLNANKIRELQHFESGGCAATLNDTLGTERGMIVPTALLPFKAPPVSKAANGPGNGRALKLTLRRQNAAPLEMSCWLPETFGRDDLMRALKNDNEGRWGSIISHLSRAKALPAKSQRDSLSAEARSLYALSATPKARSRATTNEGPCYDVDVWISIRIELGDPNDLSDDIWISVEATLTVCYDDEPMSQPLWWWMIDHGYGSDPYVMLEADRNVITQLDTVTFTGDYYMPCCGIPYVYAWTWMPAPGATDSWTSASSCTAPATTCRIRVHGSGQMAFTVAVYNSPIMETAYSYIVADPPPHVGEEEGDVDISWGGGGGSGSGELDMLWTETPKLSGPSSFERSPFFSTQISSSQSTAIWLDAHNMGEWRYTQGCAHCGNGSNTEPEVNYSIQYGDCTDFVYQAVEHVLGSSWNHDKISTKMFNNHTTTQLDGAGYVEITTPSAVRIGDIVVTTKTSGCMCGHAGIFVGFGVGSGGPRPIGWANNGLPAKPDRPNVDNPTGVYDFSPKSGQIVKYFRPVTP